MFCVKRLQKTIPRLHAMPLWLQDPSLLPLCDPPHRCPEFTAEHQAKKGFVPMFRGFLSTDRGEVQSGGPQRVLHQHRESPPLPRIETFLNAPSDVPGCCDMTGSLERHHLKDDETLQVPTPVTDPPQFFSQGVYVAPPNPPVWRIILAWWYDREVTPPPLPHPVLLHSSVQVCARVPVNPVPVHFPEM